MSFIYISYRCFCYYALLFDGRLPSIYRMIHSVDTSHNLDHGWTNSLMTHDVTVSAGRMKFRQRIRVEPPMGKHHKNTKFETHHKTTN